jgi:signal transduction histidine kinase/CheY-like chemotaxis protein
MNNEDNGKISISYIKILDNINEIVIIVNNTNNNIIHINNSAEKLFKVSINQIVGKSINTLINDFNSFTYKIVDDETTKTYIITPNSQNICNDENNLLEKECFLFNISHEIRTPLNGIIGMAQILHDKIDNNFHEYIDIISSCSNQLMDILNDILDYAKITSGNISLYPTNFNLRQCIEEIHDIIISKAIGKNLDISYSIDQNIPENIYCDQKRLKQILINLLSNSVKFTESGFIKTNITLIKRVGIKIYLDFSVCDSGIGIPKSHLEKIFNPYVQVNNKISRKYDGTGLGLSISRQLSRLLKGNIKAESILGYGSTFIVSIEAVDPIYNKNINTTLEYNTSNQECIQVKTPPASLYNNITCLVIDDNPNNRIALHQLLSGMGIKVLLASSAEESFLIIETYTFDIIFLDICMPNMDGNKTCMELRKKDIIIPIIATSSIDSTDISPTIFDDVILKPNKKKSLIRILEKYIKTTI